MRKNILTFLFAAALGTIVSSPASAAICASTTSCTLTYNEGFAGPGSFGTITLTLDSVAHAIDMTLNMSPNVIIDAGSHYSLTFNDNPFLTGMTPTFDIISVSTLATPAHTATYTLVSGTAGSYNNAPFSGFDYAISGSCTTPGSCTDTSVAFAVTSSNRPGGFTDVNQLVAFNTGGDALFATDIFLNDPTNRFNGQTGVVGVGAPVPEPASYFSLLLLGAGAVVWVAERRRKSGTV